MKPEILEEALGHISQKHIASATAKKKSSLIWLGPVAAILVLAILLGTLVPPGTTQAPQETGILSSNRQLAAPVYPKMAAYPMDEFSDSFYDQYDAWYSGQKAQYNQPKNYAAGTEVFFEKLLSALLTQGEGKNLACSPLNIYMALAMLTETTAGQSRDELLQALGADSIEALRTQAGHVWNAHYCADDATSTVLANSLWLTEGVAYDPSTVSTLANRYYASVFQGKLGSQEMNEALQSWINEQTGGLLEEQTKNLEMDPEAVLALASTIYYRCKWNNAFWETENTQGIFHGAQGNQEVTFMNTSLMYGPYLWGDDYGATCVALEDGSAMWLILPDADSSLEAVLESGEFWKNISGYAGQESHNAKRIMVNLSLPKFDIQSQLDLKDSLEQIGISQVFGMGADFSAIMPHEPAFLGQAEHAARVAIDEEGITAAAYTVMIECGAGMPVGEEVDMILDRPFLFVIQSRDNLPLFAGIVNQP